VKLNDKTNQDTTKHLQQMQTHMDTKTSESTHLPEMQDGTMEREKVTDMKITKLIKILLQAKDSGIEDVEDLQIILHFLIDKKKE